MDATTQALRATEERLRQSEDRYRSLIQGAAYGIFRTNMEGTILDANPALAQMLGYESVDELRARNMKQIYASARDRAALIDRYRSARVSSQSADVVWRRRDGTEIIVHLSARIVHSGGGDDGAAEFEGIAEDITEKRALEQQLRQAQKMEAVGRLARGVAHDFNNVLAAILGTADLLALRLKDDPVGREDADEIRKAAERGATLTRQLLAYSRSQALDPKRLDLNVVVPQLRGMLERLVGAGHVIAITTADAPARVRVEAGQLEQTLLNLVVNARDAMPQGGTIAVGVSLLDLDDRGARRYSGLPAGPYVCLSVSDTGAGIAPETQSHIFEPFFTTKGTAGTGLGLSIVYGIARDAGGTVAFTTTPGEGTTFEVVLPLAVPET